MTEPNQRPLAHLRWQRRILILIADAADNVTLVAQHGHVRDAAPAPAEREVTLTTATHEGVTVDGDVAAGPSTETLRRAYARGEPGFRLILVGKNGGVKPCAAGPVATADILDLIDAMPMRRREMRGEASYPLFPIWRPILVKRDADSA